MIQRIRNKVYNILDKFYLSIDRSDVRRTKNIQLIPNFKNRKGGKISYAEWAHVIGIFQTIIYSQLNKKKNNDILDIGCGTGLLGIASQPFIGSDGSYLGLDVNQNDVKFCDRHYKHPKYSFIHFNTSNPSYAPNQIQELKPWPIGNNSKDLVTALSVWTHLNEKDATFYFREIDRVLKIGGKAIVTFFYLDDDYKESLSSRIDDLGNFHNTNQFDWIFDTPAYESKHWFTAKWTKVPEELIGITPEALDRMIASTGLNLKTNYTGNWKEQPGAYFQDILIFEKRN